MINLKRVTLMDVAKRLGVSHTTVSLALKNHHRISPERRKQIQELAKKMGYAPDPFLSGLAAYRQGKARTSFQGTCAWLRHWKQEDFRRKQAYCGELWRGATQAAKRFGYQIEECCWEEKFTAKRLEQILLARGIYGILIPPHRPAPDWGHFDWSKFSIVRFGLSVPVPDSNVVTTDGFRAVMMAVNRMHQHGYRRIGLIVAEFDRLIGGNFCGGFLSGMFYLHQNYVIPPLVSNVARYQEDPERENRMLKAWLKRHRPDAVLISEPQLPAQLRELGYRIPQDIAVATTSVHDTAIDAGIDQRGEAVGRIAMEMLVKQLNVSERGVPEDPCRILVESRWQDGKSLPWRGP